MLKIVRNKSEDENIFHKERENIIVCRIDSKLDVAAVSVTVISSSAWKWDHEVEKNASSRYLSENMKIAGKSERIELHCKIDE